MAKAKAEIIEVSVLCRCKECGQEFLSEQKYFAHVLSVHTKMSMMQRLLVMDHAEAVQFYKENPECIEPCFRVVGAEVGIFHGRIDLIGFDREQQLCLVDVTRGKETKGKMKQLRRYRENLKWLASKVFRCRLPENVRLLIITPGKEVKEVG